MCARRLQRAKQSVQPRVTRVAPLGDSPRQRADWVREVKPAASCEVQDFYQRTRRIRAKDPFVRVVPFSERRVLDARCVGAWKVIACNASGVVR
eukprot:43799-Pyramimonas_sp.AAC.1